MRADIINYGIQPENPASEAAGDLSGGLCAGSVEKMPFKDGMLDLATAFETVFFWSDPGENFKEVNRILKNEGRFVVINNYGDPKVDWEKKVPCMTRYTAEQIGEFMKNSGFEDVEVFKKDNLFCVVGVKN